MKAAERRDNIIKILQSSDKAVPGTALSASLGVSRQIIVQDIASLRKAGHDIIPTSRGYLLHEVPVYRRVFKVIHTENEFEEEAQIVLGCGGWFEDIFVYHKVYGVIRADMLIRNRQEMETLRDAIRDGKSSMLMNITSGYHYHTIAAKSEQALDLIQDKFNQRGFLARLQDYEPVNFWEASDE